MTEAEWAASTNPTPMLEFIAGRASGRKLRLIGCAFCRHIWDRLPDPATRGAVELAESFADGLVTADVLGEVYRAADSAADDPERPGGVFKIGLPLNAASLALPEVNAEFLSQIARCFRDDGDEYSYSLNFDSGDVRMDEFQVKAWEELKEATRLHGKRQAGTIRCILGNPFRSVALHPPWLTSTVTGLADAIYADRAFDRLPILADALQDAGCEDADVLNHCREPAAHARGCWVVDLLLGRE
jgi:hypothetical protein